MSKKKKVVITIIALCLGLIFVGTKAYATTGKAINDTTRIRKKASTYSEVVAVMTKGEKIEILSEENGWYKVEYKEGNSKTTGYVRNDLLDVEEKKKEESKKEEVKVEETTTSAEKTEENAVETVEQEVVEESNQEIEVEQEEIKENTELQLTTDTELQLLPVIFSCKTGKISANTKVSVIEVVGNWTRIETESQEGWVLTSKIQTKQVSNSDDKTKKDETKKEEKKEVSTKKMYVSTVTLNLREKADTNSKIVTQLNQNDEVTVLKEVDSTWSQVKTGNYEGYIASRYLSSKKVKETTSRGSEDIRNSDEAKKKEEEAKKKAEEEAKKKAEEATKKKAAEEAKKKAEAAKKKEAEEAKKKTESKKTESTSKKTTTSSKKSSKVTGEDIIAYAKKYLGYKYVYGTAGPKTFDCSGFTSYVYKHFGYSLNRTSGGQRSNGKKVNKSDLKAGDILCFSGHVGLYIGGNKFIHAANPRKGVIISSLSESYYVKTYITARRIIY